MKRSSDRGVWRKTIHFNYYKCSFLHRSVVSSHLISCDKSRRFRVTGPATHQKTLTSRNVRNLFECVDFCYHWWWEFNNFYNEQRRAQEEAEDDEKLYSREMETKSSDFLDKSLRLSFCFLPVKTCFLEQYFSRCYSPTEPGRRRRKKLLANI